MEIKNVNDWMTALLAEAAVWEEDWYISACGDMTSKKHNPYFISADRLGKENWLDHMAGKSWVDLNTFVPAYIEACHRAGVMSAPVVYEGEF